tara:strand:- start:195 stop:689 length:495 start_codon:yes stop_codon:yes gene_type:complete
MKYNVQDNYLDKDYLNHIKNIIFNQDFPWNYKNYCAFQDSKDGPNLTNYLYQDNKPVNKYFEIFIPFLKQLKIKHLIQLRLNMVLKDKDYTESDFHVDYDNVYGGTTGIFYLNTNNGYTLLGDKEKIKIDSIENRLLLFPTNVKHAAGRQTDTNRRVVANINYI